MPYHFEIEDGDGLRLAFLCVGVLFESVCVLGFFFLLSSRRCFRLPSDETLENWCLLSLYEALYIN